MATKVLYRYEIQYKSEDGDTSVYLRELEVLEETDKTYLIQDRYWHKKRVYKNAHNSYAYDDQVDALRHFIRRTQRRIDWFDFWKEECNKALELAKEFEVSNEG